MAYDYIQSTGVIIPDTSATLTTVQSEYRVAFDDTQLVVDSGPLSTLVGGETEQRDQLAKNNANVANQINPNVAGGVFLDSLFSLFGGQRDQGSATTVTATLTGVAGTVIPEGSAAQTASGERFTSTGVATIPPTGTIDVTFMAATDGPTPLGAGELNQILDSVLGWETITNTAAGATGSNIESDASARARRNDLIALQSRSVSNAAISRVTAVDDVTSVVFRENTDGSSAIIDGITIAAKSIWVAVSGGLDSEIGMALLAAKSSGADWTGTTTVNITDPTTSQVYPVRFNRPSPIAIEIRATISPDVSVQNPVALTQTAILEYAAGNISGFAGFVIGNDVQPFDISDGVNTFDSSINARRIEVKLLSSGSFSADDLAIALDQQATIASSDITVVIS